MLNKRVLVTGGTGMVGATLASALRTRGYEGVVAPPRAELDLGNRDSVDEWFAAHRPAYVFMVAAKVGGIAANVKDPVGFLADNLRMEVDLFEACHRYRVEKILFLGSSCIYPRDCPQPMKEEYLLSGPLEPTNEGYALAKIAGLKLAEYYHRQFGMNVVCPMPCNIYGTGDHFDLERSHVLSALVRRFVDAHDAGTPSVTLWGTGVARREFIHVDDVVRAMLLLFEKFDEPSIVNVGTGIDVSIHDLALLVASAVGYRGRIEWDSSKPDGMPRKCLDISKLTQLGFQPRISLDEGINRTVVEYRAIKEKGAQA